MCQNQQFTKTYPIILTNSAYGEGKAAHVESNCWAHFLFNLHFLNWREKRLGRQPTYGLLDAKTHQPIDPREIIKDPTRENRAKFLRDNLYFEGEHKLGSGWYWEAWTIKDPIWKAQKYLGAALFMETATADDIERYFKEQNPEL